MSDRLMAGGIAGLALIVAVLASGPTSQAADEGPLLISVTGEEAVLVPSVSRDCPNRTSALQHDMPVPIHRL
jgi:hypothetical protein